MRWSEHVDKASKQFRKYIRAKEKNIGHHLTLEEFQIEWFTFLKKYKAKYDNDTEILF